MTESISTENFNKKRLKNPNVDTSFLPDRARDQAETAERERLRAEWQTAQDTLKAEPIRITFSYWDGTGHRRSVDCVKGDTISKFLEKTKSLFKELKNVSVDSLMFVKEDLILPQHFSFYDLIVTKARGKSGPLFSFDVQDDVRLLHDATREKEDTHAGKVVERRWYEKNKHIFPASRWEVFDPEKEYGNYSISDKKTVSKN